MRGTVERTVALELEDLDANPTSNTQWYLCELGQLT